MPLIARPKSIANVVMSGAISALTNRVAIRIASTRSPLVAVSMKLAKHDSSEPIHLQLIAWRNNGLRPY